jgi:hypothetical protein
MPEPPQSDVPILIETPARSYFPMVRCHYLSIEYDTPREGWGISLGGPMMPFLMLGLAGIIQQPFGAERFSNYGLIDGLFRRIEEDAGLSLNFEDIWLPNFLFPSQPHVGDVYRAGLTLFVLAFQYRDVQLAQQEFEARCKDLWNEIAFSKDETNAFRDWTAEQVSMAQNREPKDPKLQLGTWNQRS